MNKDKRKVYFGPLLGALGCVLVLTFAGAGGVSALPIEPIEPPVEDPPPEQPPPPPPPLQPGPLPGDFTFDASRSNIAGTTFQDMRASATDFCYLSRVGVENTDENGERATCRVLRGPVVWRLEAILRENNDADVECSAICRANFPFPFP